MAEEKEILIFEYEGEEYEADREALLDYSLVKAVTRVETAPAGFFDAMERVFMGRDDEYAEKTGGMPGIVALYNAASAEAAAKN